MECLKYFNIRWAARSCPSARGSTGDREIKGRYRPFIFSMGSYRNNFLWELVRPVNYKETVSKITRNIHNTLTISAIHIHILYVSILCFFAKRTMKKMGYFTK